MSVDEIPSVQFLSSRLRKLLAKARQVKHGVTIEPVLASFDIEQDIKTIAKPESGSLENGDGASVEHPQQVALEAAARNIFFEKLARCSIEDPEFVEVWNLLDILQTCAEQNQCEAALPLWIIEDLLDSQTIDGCSKVFDYLESRRERLVKNAFTKSKQLSVLRSCNELLRRLSRAENAVFCGRVFIFLFQSFPLGDKSAVNLRGEFHTENVTAFDSKGPAIASGSPDAMQVDGQTVGQERQMDESDGPSTQTDGKSELDQKDIKTEESKAAQPTSRGPDSQLKSAIVSVPTDPEKQQQQQQQEEALKPDHLYSVFWSLQHVFSNPPKIFDGQEFDAFRSALELTIKKFKSMPKVPHLVVEGSKAGTKRRRHEEGEDFASTFNPKYLTSRDLFELEMSDQTFQRHILVQSLILLDFLLSLTPKAKKKISELKAQKAMVYNYTLSDENATWAMNMKSTIAAYLQEGSDGKFYYRMVDNVLSRDKNWVQWKMESCPPIERDPISTDDYKSARIGAKRACTNKRLKATPLGSIDLSFLSDMDNVNNLETLKRPERFTAPEPETLLATVPNLDLDISEKNEERGAFDKEQKKFDEEQRAFEAKQKKIEQEQKAFEDLQKKLSQDGRHHQTDPQKTKHREELGKQRAELKQQRQELKRERQERKIKLDAEWAGLVTERASRTWRSLRLASKSRIKVFDRTDEARSMEPVIKEDSAHDEQGQWDKQGSPVTEVKTSTEINGRNDAPTQAIGHEDHDEIMNEAPREEEVSEQERGHEPIPSISVEESVGMG